MHAAFRSRAISLSLLGWILLAGCSAATPGMPAYSSVTASPAPTLSPTRTPTARLMVTEQPPTPTPTPQCLAEAGRLEFTAYHSPILDKEIPVRVYLPPCYPQGGRKYPTLYVLHGYPFNESHWDDLGVDELADRRIGDQTWPPFIIVMPFQPEPLFTRRDGGPGSYEAEMIEGVLPFIDGTYRTSPLPQSRALAGISRGAIWALEISLRNPDLFGTVAALSPSLSENYPRPEYDPFEIVLSGAPLPPAIYLMAGDEDWALDGTVRLSDTLESVNAPHTLSILPGEHLGPLWESALEEAVGFVVSSWIDE